jgi:hypothetical protein
MKRIFPSLCIALALGAVVSCSGATWPTESCTNARAFSAPWAERSDYQLQTEIARACGRVFIGFKEAGTVRGVDGTGRNLTSDATVDAMVQYLTDNGVTISNVALGMPYVSGTMPWSGSLVRKIRSHRNVDYLEPIFPGHF